MWRRCSVTLQRHTVVVLYCDGTARRVLEHGAFAWSVRQSGRAKVVMSVALVLLSLLLLLVLDAMVLHAFHLIDLFLDNVQCALSEGFKCRRNVNIVEKMH
jgi:hypothetical protein